MNALDINRIYFRNQHKHLCHQKRHMHSLLGHQGSLPVVPSYWIEHHNEKHHLNIHQNCFVPLKQNQNYR